MEPTVSVIVPAHDEETSIAAYLTTLILAATKQA